MSLIWSIRGVPDAIQARAASAAKLEGVTVGQWVSRVVHEALEQQARSKGRPSAVDAPDWTARLEALEQRMAGLESRDAAATVKTPKAPETTSSMSPEALRRIKERRVRKA